MDSCTGCDIDPKAPDVALSNAALNGIGEDRFQVYAGDIIKDSVTRKMLGTGYDIVLANIVSDVIKPLSGFVRQFMKNSAVLIASGIIQGRQDDVSVELIKNGCENIACLQPFACLPNHVTGKGMMKALRNLNPKANIVAIDYDPGASDVNQLNRIKLMMATAHKNMASSSQPLANIAFTVV